MADSTLAKRLSSIMLEKNLKQSEFADSLGISASYVSLLISGRRTGMSAALVQQIEEKYGYPTEWILHGVGESPSAELERQKRELIALIEGMTLSEINTVLAFVQCMRYVGQRRKEGENCSV